MPKKVLLLGATGLVGGHCLNALLENRHLDHVHVLARKNLAIKSDKLVLHCIDFDEMESCQTLFSVDAVICCLGTTLKQAGSIAAFRKVDYDYCLASAQLAKKAGVKHFLIVTAINSNAKSFAYYSKIKGQLQNELKALAFERLSIFQPSLLLGERNEFRAGESLAAKTSALMNALLPERMSAYKAIEGKTVGRAMAHLALEPSRFRATTAVTFYHYRQICELSEKE